MGKPWRWVGYLVIGVLGVFAALGSHLTFNQGPRYSTAQLAPTLAVVGEAAPEFFLTAADGRTLGLSGWRGHWVVLVFASPGHGAPPPLAVLRLAQAANPHRPVTWVVINTNPDITGAAALREAARGAGIRATYLTGSLASLAAVWHAYGVSVSVAAQQLVYTAALYVLGPRGHVRWDEVLNLTDGRGATLREEAGALARHLPHAPISNNYQN